MAVPVGVDVGAVRGGKAIPIARVRYDFLEPVVRIGGARLAAATKEVLRGSGGGRAVLKGDHEKLPQGAPAYGRLVGWT